MPERFAFRRLGGLRLQCEKILFTASVFGDGTAKKMFVCLFVCLYVCIKLIEPNQSLNLARAPPCFSGLPFLDPFLPAEQFCAVHKP